MTRMEILDPKEAREHDTPPSFNSAERKRLLANPEAVRNYADTLKTPTRKVCFLLGASYFRATRRFFSPSQYDEKDIRYLCGQLQVKIHEIKVSSYDRQAFSIHKKAILDLFGCTAFDEKAEELLVDELTPLILSHIKPKAMFEAMVESLRRRHVEVPSYHALSSIIITELRKHRKSLAETIDQKLSEEDRQFLDTLMEKVVDERTGKVMNQYRLTWFKKSSQSLRPRKIRGNIDDMKVLKELYHRVEDIVKTLHLSSEGIQFFANSVIKSNYLQVERRADEDRYLHLITFIVHKYFQMQDSLIDTFLQSYQNVINHAMRQEKERIVNELDIRRKNMATMSGHLSTTVQILGKIEAILFDAVLSDKEKVERATAVLLEERAQRKRIADDMAEISRMQHETNDSLFYAALRKSSRTLQNRLSDIVKNVEFDAASSDADLMAAIIYYQQKDGRINGAEAPLDFLFPLEREMLSDAEGAFDVSFYKALLFSKMNNALRAGSLNLLYSYKYRALDEYLIPKAMWLADREHYLRQAELMKIVDPHEMLSIARRLVERAYRETNDHFLSGRNSFLKVAVNGRIQVATPPRPQPEDVDGSVAIGDYLPANKSIPVAEVLAVVNRLTGFLDCFEHWQESHIKKKQRPETLFYAAIIGYGCNIGLPEMAKISPAVGEGSLAYLVNWNFSVNNLISANDHILSFIDKLAVPRLAQADEHRTVTSSDGQKFDVEGDSLNASSSYKYFGQGKGVSTISFIDERHMLFYSTVINAAEREVAYLLDGLMHNEVVRSDMHSTDTHGYSEMIFAATSLLGFEYAPRIKNLKDQIIYAFRGRKVYEERGYRILPRKYIQEDRIVKHWDEILRFITTIKLKVSTASQLFKRLNSYSRQNPLMEALKEYGKIIKTIAILKYVDDVEFRQLIEKQLNKGESAHRFKKAIVFNGGEFLQTTKEEQDIAEGCRRLIENAVLCYNYAVLSKKLAEETSEVQRRLMVKVIRNGSPLAWQHVNFLGEYNFSEEKIRDSVGINRDMILALKLP